MLKTEQILNVKFTPVSKGTYSAEEVDAFLKVVAESYDALNGEKAELLKKISILADKIENYRSDEEAIKLALLDAHRMSETITKNAQIKSDTLIGDAETRSQLILDGANRQSSKLIEEAREQAKELVENARTAVNSLTERARAESDAAVADAKAKAEKIIADAAAESEAIVSESKKLYEFYNAETARLKLSSDEFKSAMSAFCNAQLSKLDEVPVIEAECSAAAVEVEAFVETELPVEEADEPETVASVEPETELPFSQNLMAEIESEIAAIEDYAVPAEAEDYSEIPADEIEEESAVVEEAVEEEPVVYVPAEADKEEPAEAEDEVDDLFSLIDDMDFSEIDSTGFISSSIDDILPDVSSFVQAPEEVTEEVADTEDDADVDLTFETDDMTDDDISDQIDFLLADESDDESAEEAADESDDDVFEGFKIDLDTTIDDDDVKTDSDDDDDVFASLFDSMFDD